jgi:hypothetical protein
MGNFGGKLLENEKTNKVSVSGCGAFGFIRK